MVDTLRLLWAWSHGSTMQASPSSRIFFRPAENLFYPYRDILL
jgi:hypothetical protein